MIQLSIVYSVAALKVLPAAIIPSQIFRHFLQGFFPENRGKLSPYAPGL